MKRYLFSLALLFYNEQDNIIPVVTSLRDALTAAGIDFQLILVNNGSTDNTGLLIKRLTSRDKRLRELLVERNLGYGWGVINGLKAAPGEWVGYMDGDAQISPADLIEFLRQVDPDKYDMYKARRLERHDGFIRAAISEIYVILFCLLFGIKIYDVNAKPVIFKREWLPELSLCYRDWFIDAELLLKAIHLKLRIREVPVIFKKRKAGRSSVKTATIFEFLQNIIKFRMGGELKQWKKKIKSKS